MIQADILFSGSVQGVGFRYAALDLARSSGLCGEVSNLTNGQVRLVAEGDSSEIDSLVERLQSLFRVAGVVRVDRPATGTFTEFSIVG